LFLTWTDPFAEYIPAQADLNSAKEPSVTFLARPGHYHAVTSFELFPGEKFSERS